MPVQEVGAIEAWESLKREPATRWSAGWQREPDPGTAWMRLREPFFRPYLRPGFSVTASDEIFAIGSCFARGVEGALRARGFRVASLTTAFDALPITARGSNPMGFTNKYNPWAIANELEWAFREKPFPGEALVELDDGNWMDPHTTPIFASGGLEETMQRHGLLTRLFSDAARCRVLTVTLGLIEAWYDNATGLYTNNNPTMTRREPERFTLRVMAFNDVTAALDRIYELLRSHCLPGHQVVVTVSPVPLEATFTGDDVVIANTHSKSLLRAAAAEWCARHDNLHYFPSYEIVANSDRGLAWHEDGRHVRPELVGHIMDVFVEAFLEQNPDLHSLSSEAPSLGSAVAR